jgi:hypothetical protein
MTDEPVASRQVHPLFVGEVSGVDAAPVRVSREGDPVIWVNHCTMHRGRPFDERETRDLRRVGTRDLASTLDKVA